MPGLKTVTREIAGISIETTQLPPMKTYALLGRLAKIGAPGLSTFGGLDGDVDNAAALIVPAAAMFARLEPPELQDLALDVLAGSTALVKHDGKKKRVDLDTEDGINAAFAGNVMAMLGAMKFALEVNYDDFFDAARSWLNGLGASEETTENPSNSD